LFKFSLYNWLFGWYMPINILRSCTPDKWSDPHRSKNAIKATAGSKPLGQQWLQNS